MERAKLAKSHGILLSVMESYTRIVFATTEKLSICIESPHFPMFSAKCHNCNIKKRDGHGKLRNDYEKFMEKYFVKSVGTLVGGNTFQNLKFGYFLFS